MSAPFSCVINSWRAHENELRNYLQHRVADSHLAEDLLQDVFVKAMRQGSGFCELDNPRAWLYQVARNALVDYQRLHRETVELPNDIAVPAEQVEPVVQLGACVARVLSELNHEDRDIIEQCDLNGMKQQDYAKAHDLTLAAVKSRLLRARKRMRDTLSTNCQVQFDEQGRVESYVPRK
ncbi:MAG: sigma-70 family RNA polymerase sigma factor [Sideroxyarcus sp.]|nr:sigma-70 family RNA polymerase sigma factor [Sideroxyarcus sp.]